VNVDTVYQLPYGFQRGRCESSWGAMIVLQCVEIKVTSESKPVEY
jgi:hypothetical protein